MTRFFDLDEANAAIPEVRAILEALRSEKEELRGLRDDILALQPASESRSDAPAEANVGGAGRSGDAPTTTELEPAEAIEDDHARDRDQLRRILRLRMQGVIDRMQAGVLRIDELGITLREIETGLIDFPALATGRQIWLCWRLGEDDVAWWHELNDGFGGRRALVDLT